jgi:methylenetetrahydrofolate dehydrogenase (NAD+)
MSSALPHDTDERIIDVSNLARDMRQSVRDYTMALDSMGANKVKLLGILAHDGPSRDDAELYSEHIGHTCQEDGIDYELQRVMGPRPQDVEAAIRDANERDDVHGILVYYPIFKRPDVASVRGPYKNRLTGVYYKSSDDYLRDLVSPKKDVEGLSHSYNARWLYRDRATNPDSGETVVYPCTALSVYKILETQQEELKGRTITVVNRSEILGRPLAAMLASNGAQVYSIDADSVLLFRPGGRLRRVTDMPLEKCLQASSIVVSGVPTPSFSLPCEYINRGSTVVNVSEFENVKEDSVLKIPEVRFVPHVGKVTVAALEQNLVHLHRNKDKS